MTSLHVVDVRDLSNMTALVMVASHLNLSPLELLEPKHQMVKAVPCFLNKVSGEMENSYAPSLLDAIHS